MVLMTRSFGAEAMTSLSTVTLELTRTPSASARTSPKPPDSAVPGARTVRSYPPSRSSRSGARDNATTTRGRHDGVGPDGSVMRDGSASEVGRHRRRALARADPGQRRPRPQGQEPVVGRHLDEPEPLL